MEHQEINSKVELESIRRSERVSERENTEAGTREERDTVKKREREEGEVRRFRVGGKCISQREKCNYKCLRDKADGKRLSKKGRGREKQVMKVAEFTKCIKGRGKRGKRN